jgi:hypothetical protein
MSSFFRRALKMADVQVTGNQTRQNNDKTKIQLQKALRAHARIKGGPFLPPMDKDGISPADEKKQIAHEYSNIIPTQLENAEAMVQRIRAQVCERDVKINELKEENSVLKQVFNG